MKWQDPPKPQNRAAKPRPDWADELVANPRRWALVETFTMKSQANNLASRINRSQFIWQGDFPGTWEATYVTDIDTQYRDVYVRYIPKHK